MFRDMDRSFVVSGAGHFVLIVWILFGDFLFSPPAPPEMAVTEVSMVSEAEFNAMVAGAGESAEPPPSETAVRIAFMEKLRGALRSTHGPDMRARGIGYRLVP